MTRYRVIVFSPHCNGFEEIYLGSNEKLAHSAYDRYEKATIYIEEDEGNWVILENK